MTTETQLLREALREIDTLPAGLLTCDANGNAVDAYIPKWRVVEILASKLSAPAQPAYAHPDTLPPKPPESCTRVAAQPASGEADTLCFELSASLGCAPSNADVIAAVSGLINAAPPASQEQAQPSETLRDVLQERFDVLHMAMPSDPREAITALVNAETMIALDPAVSEQAEALVQRGRDEAQPSGEVVAWGLFVRIEDGSWSLQHPVRFTQADAEADIAMYEQIHQFKVEPLTVGTAPQPAQPAARVAMTDEQAVAAWVKAAGREVFTVVSAYLSGLRDAERHHGIGGITSNGEAS
jgi:hypothetical protein